MISEGISKLVEVFLKSLPNHKIFLKKSVRIHYNIGSMVCPKLIQKNSNPNIQFFQVVECVLCDKCANLHPTNIGNCLDLQYQK